MSALSAHLQALANCRRCPTMHAPVVVGRPVPSQVLLIGQAPGGKEPVLGRPFAWTAGKTLFRWLQSALAWDEETVRSRIYFAAVCRCFPGKDPRGGDRLPTDLEIQRCSHWLRREFELLRPKLVLPVGRLAISQFLSFDSLADVVGKRWTVDFNGATQDFIPLPHPSGASTWHRTEPGKTLLENSLRLIAGHPAIHRTGRSGAFESCDESGNG